MSMRMVQLGIGHDHATGKTQVIRESQEVELAGVFEPSARMRELRGANPSLEGVKWFTSLEEALGDSSVTAVAVEGRVSENLAYARAALEHGKHVWLGKPAGDDFDTFSDLLALATRNELYLQLGYMFRYNSAFQFVLDMAGSGRLGRIRSVRARMSTRGAVTEQKETWDSGGERSGGMMFILSGHVIDAVVALLGRPDAVTSFSQSTEENIPLYRKNTMAVLQYPDALAVIESAAGEIGSSEVRTFEVFGSSGTVILQPLEPPEVRLCFDVDRDGYVAGWQTVPLEIRRRYVESLRAFAATIRGEQPPDRTFAHELAVQETVLAAAGLRPFSARTT